MTGLDFAVTGVVLVSMLLGLWRGLFHELMALVGWPLAFVSSKLFAGELASRLPLPEELHRTFAAYVLIFVAVLIVWALLAWLISRLLKKAGLGWPNRMLGGLFGIVRGGLVVLALVWLAGSTNAVEHPYWKNARLSGTLQEVTLMTKQWLPEVVAQRIHF